MNAIYLELYKALDLKAENATAVATEVTTDLTNLLNAYVERFKVNKTISLVGVISADLVNDVLAIFQALVSIVAILFSPVLGLLHLVALLLKAVALVVFLLGDVLAAVLPLLAYILIPAFHLVGAIVILVADVLSPIDGVKDLGALAYLASQVAA
ncbi:hypothetical protein MAP00_005525 [Monascus purpureus]|nr:hypothetical protein MAP00_005525 [Monascus purpureus]